MTRQELQLFVPTIPPPNFCIHSSCLWSFCQSQEKGCEFMSRSSCSSWLCTFSLTILSGLCPSYHFLPLPSTSPSVWALSLRLLSGSKSLHGSQMKSNKPSPSPTTSLLPSVSALPYIAPISFPRLHFWPQLPQSHLLNLLHFGFSPTILLKLFLPRSLPTFQTQRASASLPHIWLLQYLTQLTISSPSWNCSLPWFPWYCFLLVFLFHLLAPSLLVSITGSSP